MAPNGARWQQNAYSNGIDSYKTVSTSHKRYTENTWTHALQRASEKTISECSWMKPPMEVSGSHQILTPFLVSLVQVQALQRLIPDKRRIVLLPREDFHNYLPSRGCSSRFSTAVLMKVKNKIGLLKRLILRIENCTKMLSSFP